jgi:hypothetical protein
MSETEVVPNRPLTKRQRAKLNDGASEDYLELPMGKKKAEMEPSIVQEK